MSFSDFVKRAESVPGIKDFMEDPRHRGAIDCSLNRQRLGLSREQLASMIRCDVKYIEKVESVDKTVSLDFIEEVVSFLDKELEMVKKERERRERLNEICRSRRLPRKK